MNKKLTIPTIIIILALLISGCNLPRIETAPEGVLQEEAPPQDLPEGEPPPEEAPPEEVPPEEMPPEEPPDSGAQPGSIFGWNYTDTNLNDQYDPGEPSPSAGSIMPIYEGACPSPNEVGSSKINNDGYYRVEGLSPGTYCVGGGITVTLGAGQELEVDFPVPP